MNYEKLLIKAKEAYNKCATNAEKRRLETIFPELKESEDEKIRKAIHIYLDWLDGKKDVAPKGEYSIRDMIDLVKKQGDYNRLVEEIKKRKILLSIEKEKATSANDRLSLGGRIAMLEELLTFIKEKQDEQKYTNFYCQENCKGFQETGRCFADGECKAKRKSEQKSAWSEDDEKMMQLIHKYVKASASNFDYENIQIWFRNIKKKVQPHWKPTEEQMENLEYAINMVDKCCEDSLQSLYNDLKKL